MAEISSIFTVALLNPMIAFLIILNNLLFNSFGLAIIAFTIIIRLVTLPLTLRQLHATRSMQTIQPRIQEVNKKFSDPRRRQEEIMKLYREAGVNPLGCVGPMIIQLPILWALYDAVRLALGTAPEALERLSGHLYTWSYLQHAVPLQDHFLGMDLRTANWLMVVLVAITTWAQTKTSTTAVVDDKQKAQQQMMAYMMPIVFAFFALSFPSGVSLYWIVNSIVGVVFNVFVYGLHIPMINLSIDPLLKPAGSAPALVASGRGDSAAAAVTPVPELRTTNGSSRSKRQNRRRRS